MLQVVCTPKNSRRAAAAAATPTGNPFWQIIAVREESGWVTRHTIYRLKISTPCHTQPHTVSFFYCSSPSLLVLLIRVATTRNGDRTTSKPTIENERTTTAPTVECISEYLCLFEMYRYVVRLLAPLPPDAGIHCQCTSPIQDEFAGRHSKVFLTSP